VISVLSVCTVQTSTVHCVQLLNSCVGQSDKNGLSKKSGKVLVWFLSDWPAEAVLYNNNCWLIFLYYIYFQHQYRNIIIGGKYGGLVYIHIKKTGFVVYFMYFYSFVSIVYKNAEPDFFVCEPCGTIRSAASFLWDTVEISCQVL